MRRRTERRTPLALAALLPVLLLATACGGGGKSGETTGGKAAAGGESACFKDKTMHFVVPFSPGGGYDVIARAAAPQLGKELGATVVVDNNPGAGGLKAANQIYTAKPDGLTIGLFARQGIVGSVLGGASGASFDLTKFTYIGRLAMDERVLLASPKSGLKTVPDMQKAPEVKYATAGTGAADHLDATVLPAILDAKVKIVSGYKGSSETELAVTSGSVELGSGTVGTRVSGVKNGDQVPLLVINEKRSKDLPNTPALMELPLNGKQKDLAKAHVQLGAVGRSVFGPPGIPGNCEKELESAFRKTLDNADFKKAMEKQDVPFEFLPGNDLKKTVQDVLNSPVEYKNLLKEAFKSQ